MGIDTPGKPNKPEETDKDIALKKALEENELLMKEIETIEATLEESTSETTDLLANIFKIYDKQKAGNAIFEAHNSLREKINYTFLSAYIFIASFGLSSASAKNEAGGSITEQGQILIETGVASTAIAAIWVLISTIRSLNLTSKLKSLDESKGDQQLEPSTQ